MNAKIRCLIMIDNDDKSMKDDKRVEVVKTSISNCTEYYTKSAMVIQMRSRRRLNLHILRKQFQIALLTLKAQLPDKVSTLFQDILEGDATIAKDLEVVSHKMARLTAGALDQHSAVMIALLGDAVGGPVAALLAGEDDGVARRRFLRGRCGGG